MILWRQLTYAVLGAVLLSFGVGYEFARATERRPRGWFELPSDRGPVLPLSEPARPWMPLPESLRASSDSGSILARLGASVRATPPRPFDAMLVGRPFDTGSGAPSVEQRTFLAFLPEQGFFAADDVPPGHWHIECIDAGKSVVVSTPWFVVDPGSIVRVGLDFQRPSWSMEP